MEHERRCTMCRVYREERKRRPRLRYTRIRGGDSTANEPRANPSRTNPLTDSKVRRQGKASFSCPRTPEPFGRVPLEGSFVVSLPYRRPREAARRHDDTLANRRTYVRDLVYLGAIRARLHARTHTYASINTTGDRSVSREVNRPPALLGNSIRARRSAGSAVIGRPRS